MSLSNSSEGSLEEDQDNLSIDQFDASSDNDSGFELVKDHSTNEYLQNTQNPTTTKEKSNCI